MAHQVDYCSFDADYYESELEELTKKTNETDQNRLERTWKNLKGRNDCIHLKHNILICCPFFFYTKFESGFKMYMDENAFLCARDTVVFILFESIANFGSLLDLSWPEIWIEYRFFVIHIAIRRIADELKCKSTYKCIKFMLHVNIKSFIVPYQPTIHCIYRYNMYIVIVNLLFLLCTENWNIEMVLFMIKYGDY